MKTLIRFVVILSFLILSSSLLADWTQFQYNAQHTGKSESLAPQNGELEWSLSFNSGISPYGGPSIGLFNNQTTIFLGTDNGVYLINLQGIIIDSILTVEPVKTVIAIKDEVIYFGCGDSLMAYLPSERYWSYEIGNDISHVTIFENGLYVCGGDRLWSFNLDGTFNWITGILGGGIYNSAPAVNGAGNIYVATLGNAGQWFDFKLYAFNPDGSERWVSTFLILEPGGVRITPTIDQNGNVYVATHWESNIWGASVVSIDASGEQNWRRDADILYSSLALSDSCLYYGTRQGLFARDSNGDFLWEFSTPSQISYSSPAIDSSNTIYIGTDGGLFMALNSQGELQWSYDTQEGGLGSPAIDSNMVYISSSQSLFAFKDVPTSTQSTINQLDSCFQAYPNPFNAETSIKYEVIESINVKIEIFNIKGQKIKTLINEYQVIGDYNIFWNGIDEDGKNVSSGMYFYKMQAGRYISMKKMILMK